MKAIPQVGDQYRQEHYEGEAEDMAEVLSVDETTTVPSGSYERVLQTKDRTPLEPGIVEHKYYASGVGTIFEEKVEGETGHLELLEMTEGQIHAEATPAPSQETSPPAPDEEEEGGTTRTPRARWRTTPAFSPLRADRGPWSGRPGRLAPWSRPG